MRRFSNSQRNKKNDYNLFTKKYHDISTNPKIESDVEFPFEQYTIIECDCNVISQLDGLTGRLVFFQNEGCPKVQLIQRLEGEYKEVMNLFGKLSRDSRWRNFEILRIQHEETRAFASMHCDIHPEKADEGRVLLNDILLTIFQPAEAMKKQKQYDVGNKHTTPLSRFFLRGVSYTVKL